MSAPIGVLIVDEHRAFRQAARAALAEAPELRVVGEAANRAEALALVTETLPDVVLWSVDVLRLGDVHAVQRIAELHPACRVIVLSASNPDRLGLAVVRAGARGYLLKQQAPPPDIVAAIHTVSRGGTRLMPRLTGWIVDEVARGEGADSHNL